MIWDFIEKIALGISEFVEMSALQQEPRMIGAEGIIFLSMAHRPVTSEGVAATSPSPRPTGRGTGEGHSTVFLPA